MHIWVWHSPQKLRYQISPLFPRSLAIRPSWMVCFTTDEYSHPFKVPSLSASLGRKSMCVQIGNLLLPKLALKDGTLKGLTPGCIHLWWNLPSMKVLCPATWGTMVKFATVSWWWMPYLRTIAYTRTCETLIEKGSTFSLMPHMWQYRAAALMSCAVTLYLYYVWGGVLMIRYLSPRFQGSGIFYGHWGCPCITWSKNFQCSISSWGLNNVAHGHSPTSALWYHHAQVVVSRSLCGLHCSPTCRTWADAWYISAPFKDGPGPRTPTFYGGKGSNFLQLYYWILATTKKWLFKCKCLN